MPSIVATGVDELTVAGPTGSAGYTSMGPTPIPHPPAPKYSVLIKHKSIQRILLGLLDMVAAIGDNTRFSNYQLIIIKLI